MQACLYDTHDDYFQVIQLGQFNDKAFVSLNASLAKVNMDRNALSSGWKRSGITHGNIVGSLLCLLFSLQVWIGIISMNL